MLIAYKLTIFNRKRCASSTWLVLMVRSVLCCDFRSRVGNRNVLIVLRGVEVVTDVVILTVYVLHHVDELLLVFICDLATIAALHVQRQGLKPRTD